MFNLKTLLATMGILLAAKGDTSGFENGMETFGGQLSALFNVAWPYLLGIGVVLIVGWSLYLGIRFIMAKKAEEKVEAKKLITQLLSGILLIFILVAGLPLIIQGIASWAGVTIVSFN